MKKQFKYLAAAGLIVALLLAAGCGDDAKDKKPTPEPEKKVENVVVKPQDGKYYRYPDYINDVTKTPKMTPEIVKYIDDFASTLKFHPDSKGKQFPSKGIYKIKQSSAAGITKYPASHHIPGIPAFAECHHLYE